MASSATCGFTGNSDIYGLGIRVGLYLQWFSFTITNFFNLDSLEASYLAYVAFQVALVSATFFVTFGSQSVQDQPHEIEVAILLYLYFGGSIIISYEDLEKVTFGVSAFDNIRSIWDDQLQVLVKIISCAYSIWFWASINRNDHFFDTSSCPSSIFFFANISGNPLEKLGIFFAIIAALNVLGGLHDLYQGRWKPYILLQESFWTLSKEYRQKICQFLNEDCPEWALVRGLYIPDLPEAFSESIHVEDITYSHLILREDYHTKAIAVPHGTRLSENPEVDRCRLISKLELLRGSHVNFSYGSAMGDIPVRTQNIYVDLTLAACMRGVVADMEECKTVSEYVRKALSLDLKGWKKYQSNIETSSLNGDSSIKEMMARMPGLAQPAAKLSWSLFTLLGLSWRLIFCIGTVIAVELMLTWNNVGGVYTFASVGQLIPFVIGLAILIDTINTIRIKFKKARLEGNLPFQIDDPRLKSLTSPQARHRMQTTDAKWH